VMDAHGSPALAFGVALDLTDRVRTEEQLRLSEERLRLAQEAAGIGTFDFDLLTGKRVWSKRALEICGLSEAGDLPADRRILRVVDRYFRAAVGRQIRFRSDGRPFALEYKIGRRDGNDRWISMIGRVLTNESGRPTRHLGCIVDITERMEVQAQLARNKEQLRALTGELQQAFEAERTRLAAELHDRLGQTLIGIKMNLDWILRKQKSDSSVWESAARESIQLADQAMALVQNLSMELRPQLLDAQGLRAALEWDAKQIHERLGIACVIEIPEGKLGLTPEQEIGVFRIFQEAMRNVVRHSQARAIRLHYERNADGGEFILHDDGMGISQETFAHSPCLGILGMRERALRMRASFDLISQIGQGTTVKVRIPAARPGRATGTE